MNELRIISHFQLTGMKSWYMLSHSVIFEHMEKCCLSGIVQTQKEQFP